MGSAQRKHTKVLLSMKAKDLKWYSPFIFLVGAILSAADPITDIFTLVEFDRPETKTWYYAGIAFLILPCFVFAILERIHSPKQSCDFRHCSKIYCYGCHPFSAAFARMQGFLFSWVSCCCGNRIDFANDEAAADDLLEHIDMAVLAEAVLESAPEFMLQFYAASVQEGPVEVIQIISLVVSFISLAWAFTTADEFLHADVLDDLKIKHKFVLFVTNIFFLSSRLFAVCYFTVSYKWWVLVALLCHTVVLATADIIWVCVEDTYGGETRSAYLLLFFCVHWVRDDTSAVVDRTEKNVALKRLPLSNVLFVSENFVLILLFYFSQHSDNNRYSLPVTVCVCLFSVLGSVMRVITFRKLLKDNRVGVQNNSPA